MVASNACCTLRFTAVKAEGLKNLQMLLDQDPFVQLELAPWGESVKCKAASGTNPTWSSKHNNVMELNYYGRPVPPKTASVLVRVMDAEVTRAARLIGQTSIELNDYLAHGEDEQELVLQLKDEKGKEAGTLYLNFQVVLKGTVEIKIVEATKLRSVQKLLAQDPYARVTISPSSEKKNVKKTKPIMQGGVNVRWSKKHKNNLKFKYNGEPEPRFLIEIMDYEYTQKDRVIASGGLDLAKVVSFRSTPEDVYSFTVDLADPNFLPSGTVDVEVKFRNSAFDDTKEYVKGLSAESFRGLGSEKDIFVLIKSMFYHMEGEMDQSAPIFMKQFSKSTKIPMSLLTTLMYCILIAASILITILFGAKFLSLMFGLIYPAYASFKAIESSDKEDDTQWLTYWTVFGIATITEETLLVVLKHFYPVPMFFVKIVFFVWLSHPSSRGALTLYRKYIGPFLRANEEKIDKNIRKAAKKAKEIDDMVRVVSQHQDADSDSEPDAEE